MAAQVAFGYVRISTVEQTHGFGIDVQTERIQEYAQRKGLPSLQIFAESKSGESIVHRFEFNTLMMQAEAMAEEGFQVHVVFASLDRLSRQLFDQEAIVLRSAQKGIRLHSAQEAENDTLDPAHRDDPMRTLIRQFFGAFYQFDKAIIQRRMDGGLKAKSLRGGFTGGRPPFGYRSVNQELVIDPERAAVVRLAYALGKEGIPLTTIAAILRQRYPTLCRSFAQQHVARLFAKEGLYRRGEYAPRGAQGIAVRRPELIVIEDGQDTLALDAPPPAESMDWSQCPTRMRLDIAAHFLGIPISRLKEMIATHHLPIQTGADQTYLPKASILQVRTLLGADHVAA